MTRLPCLRAREPPRAAAAAQVVVSSKKNENYRSQLSPLPRPLPRAPGSRSRPLRLTPRRAPPQRDRPSLRLRRRRRRSRRTFLKESARFCSGAREEEEDGGWTGAGLTRPVQCGSAAVASVVTLGSDFTNMSQIASARARGPPLQPTNACMNRSRPPPPSSLTHMCNDRQTHRLLGLPAYLLARLPARPIHSIPPFGCTHDGHLPDARWRCRAVSEENRGVSSIIMQLLSNPPGQSFQ